MKERDINIKEEITHDELNYNNFTEFQTNTTRNIELDGALVTQPSEESVDITPQNSLGYSDLKDMSNKQTYSKRQYSNCFSKNDAETIFRIKRFTESNLW